MKKEDIEIDDLTPKELSDSLKEEADQEMKIFSMFGIDFEAREKVKTYILAASYLRKIADGEYKPVIHAHWEYDKNSWPVCSNCKKPALSDGSNEICSGHCPNCGASMDGNKNNDWLNMKYRNKPIEVEAFCLDFRKPMPEWFFNKVNEGAISYKVRAGACGERDISADIKTLEGIMHASRGDYIIKDVNGEIYPCKPNIFKKTYEPVSDESVNQNE
ncbi:hypothetical protein [Caproicibacterium sp. BJN0003]|uniref:hypothetical protein n=1 Tax=Caproicibacterium sp. BJN0003 TaxID=2994078 RepID=UPI002255B72C|nr:hypothetical protein [Caproicibacterium sp. BJN0003]UZT82133.1 hypothetical protein OP489_11805 [Caproicibacterium sp. BJN0003]